MTKPVFYARPCDDGCKLSVAPAVASWDPAGSPGQLRSAAFIHDVYTVIAGQDRPAGRLALRLDVGLPESVPLHHMHDLDNFMYPLVPRVAARAGRVFMSVWASKGHAAVSSVAVGPAVPVDDPGGTYAFDVVTTASAGTRAYQEQIRDQVASARPMPAGGIALQLAFVVGPCRAWANLWKPTIDSLGSVLGRDDGAGEWNVRDGRITELGLHCVVDPAAGYEVRIAIRASPAGSRRAGA